MQDLQMIKNGGRFRTEVTKANEQVQWHCQKLQHENQSSIRKRVGGRVVNVKIDDKSRPIQKIACLKIFTFKNIEEYLQWKL